MIDSRIQWFGPKPFSIVCDGDLRSPTPIGEPCTWCDEPIAEGDNGFLTEQTRDDGTIVRYAWHERCFDPEQWSKP